MKTKKNRLIQYRLSEDEYQEDLKRATKAGMSMSDYGRALRQQGTINIVDNGQAIMREICTIHASLGGDELVSREIVEEGLQKLCLLLK